jgi:predicted nucleic acid-binding protein
LTRDTPHRLFLDANVLFSAAYRPQAGLVRLWKLEGVVLLTSSDALHEAERNLDRTDQKERLKDLAKDVHLVPDRIGEDLPPGLRLREKDRPILHAAIGGEATHLLTGDIADFGLFFNRRIGGVLVLTPARYLASFVE